MMLKKILSFGSSLVFLFLLTGCGTGDNWEVELNKPLLFTAGEETTIEIIVTEEGEPVHDLNLTAHFEMTQMDHGSVNVKLEEGESGIYSSTAEFPMAGEYAATFTMKKEGYTIERTIDVDVQKAEGVATINGIPITNIDLEFYRFINKLHIAINREKDQEKYQGKELDARMALLDDEEKRSTEKNAILTQIIRLRSMAALALEKGYEASPDEIEVAIKNVRDQYSQSEIAVQLIEEFGEEKFWDIQQNQYELIVLTQKVQNDLIVKVKDENPDVGEQEINYLAQKEYEDLLVSQVNSMDIVIF